MKILILMFFCILNFRSFAANETNADTAPTPTGVPCIPNGSSESGKLSLQTKELFEQSKILSIIPKLLDIAQIKDLIPFINEVEVKKDKTISDYLMLNDIYEKIGDPEKQITNLTEAMKVLPRDPLPKILLALKKIEKNDYVEAKNLLFDFIQIAEPKQFYLVAYAIAVAEPYIVIPLMLSLIWFLAIFQYQRRKNKIYVFKDIRIALPIILFIFPLVLAVRFLQTNKAIPLGALLLVLIFQLYLFVNPSLKKYYMPIFRTIGNILYYFLNGTILAKKMEALSSGTRVLIAITSIFALGTIVPTIQNTDLKYTLLFVCSFLFYSTVGSLLVSFFRSRDSLFISLKWIAISATFPFLMSYLVANWNDLGLPLLYAQMPSKAALEHLFSYLLYWGISVGLALHLGKIMAQALVEPVNEIMSNVALIEGGQFNHKILIQSKDEIGLLSQAVNRMGDGLAKREKIEKTFSKYIDRRVAERILDGVETELRIEGQSMNAVVMFVDIRGFTSMSEKTTPQELVTMLNIFFSKMVQVVQSHEGVVDKFIGDNVMCVWGIPTAIAHAEEKAAKAALLMKKEIDDWNIELQAQGFKPIGIGIGINSGEVVAGSLGSSERMEYTVIGDVVNTAKRIEQFAQSQEVLISESCFQKISTDFKTTELPGIQAKGKADLVKAWRLDSVIA